MSKKLVQINVVCNGSTGRIMCDIAKTAEEKGYKTYCFYGRGNANPNVNCIKIGNKLATYFHVLITRLFDKHGHGSYFATKKLINQLRTINPDIIHLHNIHGYYLNLGLLFKYLKNEYKGKTIWTLHDCWTFTGHCSHYTIKKCDKWKTACFNCIQKEAYPKSLLMDSSKKEYEYKKKLFLEVSNLTITTPSNWLADQVKMSFLKDYQIKVINNGIDLNVFKPTKTIDIFTKYNIPKDKKILLGVAGVWGPGKGLDVFTELAKIIDNKKTIVLVGLKEKQLLNLPENIIGIKRTENIEELINIYTQADIFINPSIEETFSLVTLEAMACGTPAIVSDSTATKELIAEGTGFIIKKNNIKQYLEFIADILKEEKSKYKNNLLNNVEKYKITDTYLKYIKEYGE